MNPLREDERADETQGPSAPPARNPFQIAWQRKPIVALGILVGVALAAIYASQKAPVYQSTAQVMVVKKFADAPVQPGGVDPRLNFYEDYVSTHIAVIRSQVVIDAAVKKLEEAVKDGELSPLASLAGQSNPTATILAGLTAARDTKESGASNVINLSLRGLVSEDCRVIITAIVESYKRFLQKAYETVSDEAYNRDVARRDEIQKALDNALEDQDNLRKRAPDPLLPTKDGTPVAQVRLNELESKKLSLNLREAELKERLKELEEAKKDGTARELVQTLTAAPTEKTTATEVSQDQLLLPLLLEEQVLLRDYAEDHPQVQAVRKKIEMIRDFLSPEKRATQVGKRGGEPETDPVESYAKSTRQELAVIRVSLQSLAGLATSEKTEARKLNDYANDSDRLQKKITKLEQLIEELNARLKVSNELRKHGGYDAQMLSLPAAGSRVGTGLLQMLLAGAAVGLLAGVGLAYLSDITDKSFRNPEEIRRRLGLPIIAHVPMMDDKDAVSSPDAPQFDQSLAAYLRPKSGEAEAYRSLRTALYFSCRGKGLKVIQVTSPSMGDGKTTMASNLAIAIAQAGKRVVLVDADLRRPRVHALFGVRPEHGLSSVIAGEIPLKDTLLDSGIERLTLLTCGPRPENPSELLTQPQFESVIEELRPQFDFIIVDTPPLLAVTDPAIVVSRMDAVLLTVRVSKNGRPAAERARELLYNVHANVLGVIVNGVGKANGAYGYEHYHYGYEYGHGGEYIATTAETNGHAETNGTHGTNGTAVKRNKRGRKKTAGWLGRWFRS